MTAAEMTAALAGALTIGLPAFPCAANKSPAIPGPGGHKHATADPVALRELWWRHPGPLVGVPMGEPSGLDAFDIDGPRHPEATEWWQAHRDRLPPTRVHQTRSGGLHLLFRHAAGLRCSVGRIAPGIDVRSTGGFLIWWPVAGLPVLCDAPAAQWPQWLLDELTPPAPASRHTGAWAPPSDYRARARYAAAALRSAVERVARAPVGTRNTALNSETYGLGRLVAAGLLDGQYVADALAAAAVAAGLTPHEIAATLRSAFGARGLV
jgi:Bifunctional DNA primase/polymerase, N-terminal